MIAAASRGRHRRLFPLCRAKRCRSVATDGDLCARCLAYFLAMPSERELAAMGVSFEEWRAEYRRAHEWRSGR